MIDAIVDVQQALIGMIRSVGELQRKVDNAYPTPEQGAAMRRVRGFKSAQNHVETAVLPQNDPTLGVRIVQSPWLTTEGFTCVNGSVVVVVKTDDNQAGDLALTAQLIGDTAGIQSIIATAAAILYTGPNTYRFTLLTSDQCLADAIRVELFARNGEQAGGDRTLTYTYAGELVAGLKF